MPGSGNQSGKPRSKLSEKLLNEVKTALAMITKDISAHPVDVSLKSDWKKIPSAISAKTYTTSLQALPPPTQSYLSTPTLSPDQTQPVKTLTKVTISKTAPCDWEALIHYEAILSKDSTVYHTVTFDNVALPDIDRLDFEKISETVSSYPKKVDRLQADFKTVSLDKIKPLPNKSYNPAKFKTKTQKVRSGLYRYPIRKQAVPLHRFSMDLKRHFKMVLAEKLETESFKIGLTAVYDRINLSAYESIQQDDYGNILCYPKKELLGKQSRFKGRQKFSQPGYLVVGSRVDTNETAQALITELPEGLT